MTAITPEHLPKPSARQAMLVFCAGVSAALHIWKLPPALPVLQETLALTLSQAGWLISVFQLAGMLLGLIFGLFVQRIGQKRSILSGLIVLSLASFAGAFTQSVTALLLFRVVEGFALLMVTMAAPSLMRQVAPKERLNFFVALWSAYIPTATVIALFAGAAMLSVLSWESLWISTGVVSLLMVLLVGRAVTDAENTAPAQPALGQAWQSIKETLTVKEPWLVAISFSMYSGQWVAIISFLPIICLEAGISGAEMGVVTAVAAGVNIIGNLMAGKLLQRGVAARTLLFIAFATMIVTAFVAFGLNAPNGVLFTALTLFSAVGGLAPATLFNLAMKVSATPRAIPVVIGWQQQWISFGQFAGPIIVAFVVDYTHGWQSVWLLTGAWGVLGMILTWVLCRSISLAPARSGA